MTRNDEAGNRLAHGSGSKEKRLTGNQRGFFTSNYKQFSLSVQCKNCGSDYMRFAFDGDCQRCQQRAEYLRREQTDRVTTPKESGGQIR